MKERKIKILIILMTFAVLGLIVVQVYWSIKTIATEEIRFNAKVNEIMRNVVINIGRDNTAKILIEKVGGADQKVIWLEDNGEIIDSNEVVFYTTNSSDEDHDEDNEFEIKVEITPDDDLEHQGNDLEKGKIVKRVIKYKSKGKEKISVGDSQIDTLIFQKQNLISEVIEEMTSFKEADHLEEHLTESYLDSILKKEFGNSGFIIDFDFGIKDRMVNEFILVKSGASKDQLEKSKFNISISPHSMFAQPYNLIIHIPNKFGFLLKSVWIMLVLSLLFVGIIVAVYVKTLKMFLDQKKITEIKNDLINNITHEFKTPISSISLATEALQEPQLLEHKDSVQKYSEIITEENNRLTKLVENLLNTAAFERSKIELEKENFNVAEVIHDIIIKSNERFSQISISFLKETVQDSIIKADLFHFTNIMNNLVDNAIKYSEGVIDISIKLMNTADGIEISVSDKGIGISKSDIEKVFETFYRVPTGNIHNVKGNGIGLSYVKKIVEAHNGWVRVKSKIGEGSTFLIYLPNE